METSMSLHHRHPAPDAAIVPTLTYEGTTIRQQGPMLNLTDMWIAAGRPKSRRPNHWLGLRLIGTRSNRDAIGARGAGAHIVYRLADVGALVTIADLESNRVYAEAVIASLPEPRNAIFVRFLVHEWTLLRTAPIFCLFPL